MRREEIIQELNARLDYTKRIKSASDEITARFHVDIGMNRHLDHVPQIVCADGFKMSVQASAYHYCYPRNSKGPWSAVEIGFPSERVEAFMPYIDGGEDDPTGTVYGYVPIDLVADAISDHGGFGS